MIVTDGVPQDSTVGCVLLIVFVDDLKEEMVCTHFKFPDDTKLGGAIDTLSCHTEEARWNREMGWQEPHEVQ